MRSRRSWPMAYTGETLSYTLRLPYKSWMDNARLNMKQELTGCRGESRLFVFNLGSKVQIASRAPYEVNPLVSFAEPSNESKSRNRTGSAFLDFQVGRSVILPDFRRNPVELGKINDAVSGIAEDKDVQLKGITIEGFASPEGKYESNEKLSRDRAGALKNYLRDKYRFSESLFIVKWVAEDWEGLKLLVEQSSLEPKEQLLTIITSPASPDAKEQQLKGVNRGIPYSKMLRELFPDLRRVEYRIDYSVRNYTTAEAKEVIKRTPGHLSHAEMYRVALDYGKDSREHKEILMETIPAHFSDPVAGSNAAALLIGNKEYHTARRLLEKADNLPAARNNLGVVALYLGELDEAEALFKQAKSLGNKEADHNLEELKKKREDINKRKERGLPN